MEIKNTSKPTDETIDAQEVIGKPVFDIRAKKIGEVRSIHYDPKNLSIEGIRIDKGFFNDSDYVGKGYIVSLGKKGAVLSIVPVSEIYGMKVIDNKGNKIGKIKGINRTRKTNNLVSMVVDRGMGKNDLVITENFIDSLGENMKLNEEVEA
jgi:sporulation protein YlmC with PRC-barrel domain